LKQNTCNGRLDLIKSLEHNVDNNLLTFGCFCNVFVLIYPRNKAVNASLYSTPPWSGVEIHSVSFIDAGVY